MKDKSYAFNNNGCYVEFTGKVNFVFFKGRTCLEIFNEIEKELKK